MNKAILIGRLTKDPASWRTQGETPKAIVKYTLAIDRYKQPADFISCTAFDKDADFASTYFRKGMRVAVTGNIKTGSYEKPDGTKISTSEIIIEHQEFADGKYKDENMTAAPESNGADADGFTNVGKDCGLPFN